MHWLPKTQKCWGAVADYRRIVSPAQKSFSEVYGKSHNSRAASLSPPYSLSIALFLAGDLLLATFNRSMRSCCISSVYTFCPLAYLLV